MSVEERKKGAVAEIKEAEAKNVKHAPYTELGAKWGLSACTISRAKSGKKYPGGSAMKKAKSEDEQRAKKQSQGKGKGEGKGKKNQN